MITYLQTYDVASSQRLAVIYIRMEPWFGWVHRSCACFFLSPLPHYKSDIYLTLNSFVSPTSHRVTLLSSLQKIFDIFSFHQFPSNILKIWIVMYFYLPFLQHLCICRWLQRQFFCNLLFIYFHKYVEIIYLLIEQLCAMFHRNKSNCESAGHQNETAENVKLAIHFNIVKLTGLV